MFVGRRQDERIQSAYQERSKKSINHAMSIIENSRIFPFVDKALLYGSCARHDQRYDSDVDLFLVLDPNIDLDVYRDDLIKLKGDVSPLDYDMPEVDLHTTVGSNWETSNMLYYQNVKRDGITIWKTKGCCLKIPRLKFM